jgi:hypothetical protein
LNDALNATTSMGLKQKEAMNHLLLYDVLIDDDDHGLFFELGIFARNIKKEVIGVIDYFLFSLTRYDENSTHNMLA